MAYLGQSTSTVSAKMPEIGADLRSHHARIHSGEHIEGECSGFTSTRLTLTDKISWATLISTAMVRGTAETYGLMRSIGNAFSWIFEGFLNLAA
jgi:hypothetical protein